MHMSKKSEAKRPTARKDMTIAAWTWKEMKRNKTGYFMIAPFMILFTIFTVFPVVLSIAFSFTTFNLKAMIRLFKSEEETAGKRRKKNKKK